MAERIKVLIVEDSPTVSQILVAMVESDPALQLVGVATDGAEAIRLTSRNQPNIITMDVNMPRMGGLEATEYIMAHQPTPILVLTAFSKQDMDLSFKMLSAGALEIIEKPDADEWKLRKNHLLDRIKLLSRIKVITHVRGKAKLFNEQRAGLAPGDKATAPLDPAKVFKPPMPSKPESLPAKFPHHDKPIPTTEAPRVANRHDKLAATPDMPLPPLDSILVGRRFDVVGIAASTGGPPALARLLKGIPANLPVPIFLVQHIPAGFSNGLADWLNGETKLTVKLAEEGEIPKAGWAYLPGDDRHLTFYADGRLRLDESPPRYGLRPSADYTFESMAKVWPSRTLAIILTGMGRDGTVGMLRLKEAGGYNIAQDEATSVIFGMPKAAIDAGVINKVLALGHVAPYVRQIFKVENS